MPGTATALLGLITAIGGSSLVYAGRLVRDVWVAKINAEARVEVARLRYGYRLHGGAHRRR
jgi:hypothetical protein